jgi:tetratricopeptide (TPR) repeat protein
MAHREAGRCHHKLRQPNEALPHYDALVQLDPSPDHLLFLGDTLGDVGRYSDAIRTYEAAVAVDPLHVAIHPLLHYALHTAAFRKVDSFGPLVSNFVDSKGHGVEDVMPVVAFAVLDARRIRTVAEAYAQRSEWHFGGGGGFFKYFAHLHLEQPLSFFYFFFILLVNYFRSVRFATPPILVKAAPPKISPVARLNVAYLAGGFCEHPDGKNLQGRPKVHFLFIFWRGVAWIFLLFLIFRLHDHLYDIRMYIYAYA